MCNFGHFSQDIINTYKLSSVPRLTSESSSTCCTCNSLASSFYTPKVFQNEGKKNNCCRKDVLSSSLQQKSTQKEVS